MRVAIVTGIWPPDVGGPASHAPEVAEVLRSRGHEVEVVTTAERAPTPEPYSVRWVSRRQPVFLRYARGALLVARVARRADVVYSTGMYGRTCIGSSLARTPRVVKLTGDPAYERAIRYGLTREPVEEFQRSRSLRVAWLKIMRDLTLVGAQRYLCPSASLGAVAARWHLVPSGRIEVLPNPIGIPELGPRDELRRRHGFAGPTLVFAGRLSVQKSLDVALRAVARCDGVALVVAGDGPEGPVLEALAAELGIGDRVRFLGARPRSAVLELLAAADAELLSSGWENFPHALVEGLAAGTPVIATDVGGVGEIVDDGVNGLLVPPGDVDALAAAIGRFFADGALQESLRTAAPGSVERFAPEPVYDRLEVLLREAAA
ncbi:MAG TPA: glycosyltransferase family 4 protein [Gaiellaceae bacterium]|nr:glycosyltransferase family 4 protein [Gaiellaceae bacterium]